MWLDGNQNSPEKCDTTRQRNMLPPSLGESPVDINLCCGVGGLALGLGCAGFRTFDFFDRDEKACVTLRRNIATGSCLIGGRVFEGDLSSTEWLAGGIDVRLLAAGTPCQPFSIGGSRRGHDDSRNLFPTLLKAIRTLQPRAVLIENVRGLERGSHKPYLDYLLNQLRYPEIGPRKDESWTDHYHRLTRHQRCGDTPETYRVAWKVLNSADYGVAQIRHRLFIVAMSAELPAYEFPEPTHSKEGLIWDQCTREYWESRNLAVQKLQTRKKRSMDGKPATRPWVTVRDAITDLPSAHPQECGANNNHWSIPGARIYPGAYRKFIRLALENHKSGYPWSPWG